MNKDLVLKKNDLMTFMENGIEKQLTIDLWAEQSVKELEKYLTVEVLKVERPTYTTIYEVKEILDKEERKYLSALIKPFRKQVVNICKNNFFNKEYIKIKIDGNCANIVLPTFKKNSMYKNMELYREYTIDELGL